MQRLLHIIPIFALCALVFACSHDKQADEVIDSALVVMDENPDSTLSLLNNIKGVEEEWPKSQRMRYELVYAQAQNKAYVPFTSDSVVLEVADYYNRHGSDNERMMANYMVGCAYRDLGDAPTALKYLNKAVESVDASDKDCDLSTLMRVHSQMGGLYQDVEAFENDRSEEILAETLAWQIGDTLSAIQLKWARACSLQDEQLFAKSLAILDSIEDFGQKNDFFISPDFLYPMRIDERLFYNDIAGADKLLRSYEKEIAVKGSCDSIPNRGYYRLKGRHFNMSELPDSAIYMYNRHLNSAKEQSLTPIEEVEIYEDYYKALLNAYTTKNQPDSVVKYANLYCQFNDSTTRMHSSEQLLRMQSLYNYSKAKEEAFESEQKALRLFITLIFTVLSAILVAFGVWKINKKRLEEERQNQVLKNAEYLKILQGFEKSSKELQLFKSDTEQFKKEKEEEIYKLRKALSMYQADTLNIENWDEERNILSCEVAEHLHSISSRGQKATASELDSLVLIAQSGFAAFYERITDESIGLSEKEVAICTLIRFRFISSEIAVLTGLSPQRITNLKSAINKKLFHAQGAKTLESKLIGLK